ncbi:MAG: metallophosphoesterase [Candidatus Saganbacteria bacterium]|nr:metallophosphoesterase [Candidatus Saganbacteria bacterium]
MEKEELLVRFFRERLEAGKGVYAYKWTFVISDLHLLDYMHRDIFDLLRLIHIVKKVNGMLIINGDLLDLWREKDIFKIISKNQILFEALKAVKVFYVTGNHDSKVSALAKKDLWGIEIDSRFYDHENRIFVLHGNIFDKWNAGKGAIIGEQVTDFAKFLEDAFGEKTTKWLEVTRKKFSTQKGWEEEKVERIMDGIDEIILFAAREEAKRKPLNPEPFTEDRPLTVVIGHYHFPGDSYAYKEIEKRAEEKYGKKVRVIFSGSWFGRDSYAGEVVCFGKERNTGDMLTSTFIWQYPVAQELAALYSKDWKEHSLPM